MELQDFKEFFFSPLLLPRRSAGPSLGEGLPIRGWLLSAGGPRDSNSGQPWLQTGTLKQATTRPVIPVSTLVSGIDNGPVHLGPLELAWCFKGEDREPDTSSCERVEPRKRGMGERSFWHVTRQNMFGGSDLEHCGIMYKYRAYGMESF